MKRYVVILTILLLVLVLCIAVVFGRNLLTGNNAQYDPTNQTNTESLPEIAEGPAYITLSENSAEPKLTEIKSGYGLIFRNETDNDMEVALDGVIKVDKIKIPANGTASGPIFSTKGEISIILDKNKIGTVNVR